MSDEIMIKYWLRKLNYGIDILILSTVSRSRSSL